MNANDETRDHGEMSDPELDLLLTEANHELLEHIQAVADPTPTLTAIMAMNDPAKGHETTQAAAALTISLRAKAHSFASDLDYAERIAVHLDETLAHIRSLRYALSRVHDLDEALARACSLGDALARDLNETLARYHAHVRALTRVRDLPGDLDDALALVRDLARDLDDALALVRDLARDLDDAPARGEDIAQALDVARARACTLRPFLADANARAEDLKSKLDMQQVNASGADLSGLKIQYVDVLNGVIWTHQTIWPPDIAEQVLAQSEEIQPSVYQVRIGRTPDRSSLTSA